MCKRWERLAPASWCWSAPSKAIPGRRRQTTGQDPKLRIFSDFHAKINLSLQDMDGLGTQGGLLIVSQFTLAADASGVNRLSSTAAAAGPDDGRRLQEAFVAAAKRQHGEVQHGEFAAHMQVHLVNDGPAADFSFDLRSLRLM